MRNVNSTTQGVSSINEGRDHTAPTLKVTPPNGTILGVRIHATTYTEATEQIIEWAQEERARAIFAANVHMLMEGYDDPGFRAILNSADLVTPDGMPLVWGLRIAGLGDAERVYGPRLMLRVCAAAASHGVPIGLYGGAPDTLDILRTTLLDRFPGLSIPYAWSPPFRPLADDERSDMVASIRASGARILLVSLGCPKQEQWIHSQRDELSLPMLGVGAAFDFISGRKRQAPPLVQAMGLEWLFRLCAEPRRLWRRYLKHNPRFVVLFARQLITGARPSNARSF
jgi:N-acetylglucosaminyldiphosphoundecaprenol N-acetyl-beta-D-mannosaminyltransferase